MREKHVIKDYYGETAIIRENSKMKALRSRVYNYNFNKETGFFARYGHTVMDDPNWSSFGPEIADIEISTVCNQGCEFCYKSNTAIGKNMDLYTFAKVFDNLPKTVTQIAFGIGSIDANVDMFEIFSYCRTNGVIPNVTINGFGMNDYFREGLAAYCGAVAVSLYDYEVCYSAIANLGQCGMKQINIHAMLSEETYDRCMQVLKDAKTDERLKNYLNAIVFLWLKPKGRGEKLHQVSREKYHALVHYALINNIRIGFDSCSASNFLRCANTLQFKDYVEPCESTLFSIYINVDGIAYPCSFAEGNCEGVSVIENDFLPDVWMSEPFMEFRDKVLASSNIDENGCRKCPLYNLEV
jgi:MoaA/NifB/PqqE/SkfB family radical SAM enzyme